MTLRHQLALLLTLAALATTVPPVTRAGEGSKDKNVTVSTARTMLKKKSPKAIVLDVRTPAEFAAGHLAGAVNIDKYGPTFEQSVLTLSKTRPIVVYCATGRRSAQALELLTKHGYTNVYNMLGGIEAWKSGGGAVVKN